jgi:hypothetical protein
MWDVRLQELLDFRRIFDHVNVPRHWPDNPPLGRWVLNQRRDLRTGRMPAERRRRLEQLGIRWGSADDLRQCRDLEWNRLCDALAAFRRKHGHSEVPSDWPGNPRLGAWAARQRHLFRTGSLRDDRRRRLEAAGIDWPQERGRSRDRDDGWNRMCDRLADFRREHGHCRVPKGWHGDPALARWIARQRHYLRTHGIPADRRARLEELGAHEPAAPSAAAPAPGPRELAWRRMLHSLASFRGSHGHCNVPRRWSWNLRLARWVHHQRDLRRRGLLSRERQLLLDELGFQWIGKEPSLPRSAASR